MKKLFIICVLSLIICSSLGGTALAFHDDPKLWWNGLKNVSTGVKGVKADYYIVDRHDYHDNSVALIEGRGGADNTYTGFGWQVTDGRVEIGFELSLHVKWPDGTQKWYYYMLPIDVNDWNNLKVERNDSTGKWAAYLEYGNPVVTFNWPYYASSTTTETTQTEVSAYSPMSDSNYGGRVSNIMLKAANNVWYSQDGTWSVSKIKAQNSGNDPNPFNTNITVANKNWEAKK